MGAAPVTRTCKKSARIPFSGSGIRFALFLLFCLFPILGGGARAGETPVLVVSPASIEFGTVGWNEEPSRVLEIRNGGAGDLEWIITGAPPWVRVSRHFGKARQEASSVDVTVVASLLAPGENSGDVVVTSTGGTRVLPVSADFKESRPAAQERAEKEDSWKIFIIPEKAEIEAGKSAAFKARVEYADRYTEDITQTVVWISSNPFVARFISPGVLEGISRGSAEITAKLGDVFSPSVPVAVTALNEPALEAGPLEAELGRLEAGDRTTWKLSIANKGKAALFYEVLSGNPWIRSDRDASVWSFLREARKARYADAPGVYVGCPESTWEAEDYEPYERWREGKRRVETPVAPGEREELTLAVDTVDLAEGDHEGSVLIRSNAGDLRIPVKVRVVRLRSIFVSPLEDRMTVGQRRTFQAVGIWSDGRRTDLSGDGQWIVSDRSVGTFLAGKPVFVARNEGTAVLRKKRGTLESNSVRVSVAAPSGGAVLSLSPREIDLGPVGPGETARDTFRLENVGSETLEWEVPGPDGWTSSRGGSVHGILKKGSGSLHLTVSSVDLFDLAVPGHEGDALMEVRLEKGGDAITLWKYLSPGPHREVLPVYSNGGMRHVYFKLTVSPEVSRPRIAIEPYGIDFGTVSEGKRAVQRIQVLNQGMGSMNWSASLEEEGGSAGEEGSRRGRYVPFRNDGLSSHREYVPPDLLRSRLSLTGAWENGNGYPAARGAGEHLSFTFTGTGISLVAYRETDGGKVQASIDGYPVADIDLNARIRERGTFPVAGSLENGFHVLDIVSRDGRTVIEGVRILGETVTRGKKGWIRIYPDNGTTTKEKDFINVAVNAKNLAPGLYQETVLFSSNGGNAAADISLEVSGAPVSPRIDILLYRRGFDCLFTPGPGEEILLPGDYEYRGVAFQLFRKGTPGTTEFYRWFHPEKGSHFYSHRKEREGVNLEGYVFQGAIGNIATSRLSGTRELYRWVDPGKGVYFYSTDLKEERTIGKEYRYDGIAGYVR